MDVEALLQAAADAGVMNEEGEIPEHIRRLWSTYNTAINSACLGPELRLLQVKNERRQAAHPNAARPSPGTNTNIRQPSSRDPMDLDMSNVDETTLITSFSTAQPAYSGSGSRSIYQVCRERQAGYHATRNPV